MKELQVESPTAAATNHWGFPVLLVLFICSGCSALIYEIVWFQFLELIIGSSAISLGILLGVFMGGMCLGSIATPLLISRRWHPLRVYALLEIGIGLIGMALLFGMPLATRTYVAWAGPGVSGLILRGALAGACLLVPALLMGATLPAVSRWVEATPKGVSWLGYFYAGNIAGAVVGSLLTGFYLLRFRDAVAATEAAFALNVLVAGCALVMAAVISQAPETKPEREPDIEAAPGTGFIYAAIAASGFTALAAEVIWTRLLALLFGATVYAFALILAVFLLGLGIGASFSSALARRRIQPRMGLALCQVLLCGGVAWAAYQVSGSLPYWPVDPARVADPWWKMRFDLLRATWAVLPAAILWGASVPLALASVASRSRDPGRWVGGVYAANTVGAIAGSLAASLWLVAWIGSRQTQRLLIAISACSGLLLIASIKQISGSPRRAGVFATVLGVVAIAGVLIWSVPEIPPEVIAYGRRVTAPGHARVIYAGEGLTASIAVSETANHVLNYHSAGKIQASSEYQDMRLQRMLGHLTTLLPANPRNFLVIGLGAGVTAGAVSIEPRLSRETVVEIEPLVPKTASRYFSDYNFNVVGQAKVQIEIDDGRHFLLTTKDKFDAITSDPFDPWVRGTAALYTTEFFELCKEHLNSGGVVTQFVQLYETNEEVVKSELATFFEVFPHARIFANTVMRQGYDLVLVGQQDPEPINADRLEDRLQTPEYAPVARSLQEIGFYSGADLLSTYIGQASDLRFWLKGADINRDRNLRLQYLAGAALDLQNEGEIYSHMTAFGPHSSPDVFTGSQDLLEYISHAIQMGSLR